MSSNSLRFCSLLHVLHDGVRAVAYGAPLRGSPHRLSAHQRIHPSTRTPKSTDIHSFGASGLRGGGLRCHCHGARIAQARRQGVHCSEPSAGRSAGPTYRKSSRIKAIAPRGQLAFRFKHCAHLRAEESALPQGYFRKFGEVPPLNGRTEFITKKSD